MDKGSQKRSAHNFCSPPRRLSAFLAKGNIVKLKTERRQLQLLTSCNFTSSTLAKSPEKQNGFLLSSLKRFDESRETCKKPIEFVLFTARKDKSLVGNEVLHFVNDISGYLRNNERIPGLEARFRALQRRTETLISD